MKIRSRVAPSPTGHVHIGTIYNAIFAHALAKSQNGDFILRLEDTDQARTVAGATTELYEIMDAFGLTPDEGPIQGGQFGPYIQSEKVKTGAYTKAAERLIASGNAYYCFYTTEELKQIRAENQSQKIRKVFRSKYRDLPVEEARIKIENGEKYVIRLKIPSNETISVHDAILGKLSWNSDDVDDQVLLKSDGFPTYHLAVVVDDHDMKITHVTRGFDWVPSTPKQILIYRYLGYDIPTFAHSGLILDPKGGKLSKRKGNVAAREFLVKGYLVEAIINFLILIGWSPNIERVHGKAERELFTHKEFIQMYKLSDRKKTSGIFSREKLLWFNQQYIMSKNNANIANIFLDWIKKYGDKDILKDLNLKELKSKIDSRGIDYLKQILELEKSRTKLLSELPDAIAPFYSLPQYVDHTSIKQIKKLTKQQIILIGETFSIVLDELPQNTDKWVHETWENKTRDMADKLSIKHGQAFMALRYIIMGRSFSPPLFEVMQIMGSKEIHKRIKLFR